jgi:bifunctional non-homologous end joining protein LigD
MAAKARTLLQEVPGARRAAFTSTLSPMQAEVGQRAFSDTEWLFEPKLDGVRAVAAIHEGRVDLYSRQQQRLTAQYPTLVTELGQLGDRDAVLDGEIVALDAEHRPSFLALQARINVTRASEIARVDRLVPAYYFAFDLVYLDGYDLRRVPLIERKRLLSEVLAQTEHVQLLPFVEGDGESIYQAALQNGFEGVSGRKPSARWYSANSTMRGACTTSDIRGGGAMTAGRWRTCGAGSMR